MTTVIYRPNDKKRPTVDDFTIIKDDFPYYTVEVGKSHYLLPQEIKEIAKQLRVPNWENVDHKLLDRYLAKMVDDQDVGTEIGFERPIPVYVYYYTDVRSKRTYRTVSGKVDGLILEVDDSGMVRQIYETHGPSSFSVEFDEKGKIVYLLYDNRPLGFQEDWKGDEHSISYYIDGNKVDQKTYLEALRALSKEVEEITLIPRDVMRGIFEKY